MDCGRHLPDETLAYSRLVGQYQAQHGSAFDSEGGGSFALVPDGQASSASQLQDDSAATESEATPSAVPEPTGATEHIGLETHAPLLKTQTAGGSAAGLYPQKEKSSSGCTSVAYEGIESQHDKPTPWTSRQQHKASKSSLGPGQAPSGSTSGKGSYANDSGVVCGRQWGDGGLCQFNLDDSECLNTRNPSLTPAVLFANPEAVEGGGITNKRFLHGKPAKAVSKRLQKSKKTSSAASTSTSLTVQPSPLDQGVDESPPSTVAAVAEIGSVLNQP